MNFFKKVISNWFLKENIIILTSKKLISEDEIIFSSNPAGLKYTTYRDACMEILQEMIDKDLIEWEWKDVLQNRSKQVTVKVRLLK